MENTLREKTKELMILLIIVMIGTLIRLPIGNFAEIDVTRLNDPDSYFYARKAIELYNTPFSEWSLSVSRADDPLMNSVYPETDNNLPILLSVLVAFACRVFKFLPIDSVIYYFVTVLCPLSAIPAFFFVKHHSNRIGGYVAALAMAIAPSYFSHTVYGYFDTDAIIMVAATSFVLCFFMSVPSSLPVSFRSAAPAYLTSITVWTEKSAPT